MNIDSLKNVYIRVSTGTMGISAGNMGDEVLVIMEFSLVAVTKEKTV